MLMVIFGAGASFDSSADFPVNTAAREVECWRPPLADSLFTDRYGIFREMVADLIYSKLRPILPYLRRPSAGRTVEQELESLQDESKGDAERKRQPLSVRYYLHDALLRISNQWLGHTSNVTNYVTLLDQIRHSNSRNEPVCLVTFNYDLLLDRALFSFDYKGQNPDVDPSDAHSIFRLLKPHGSVDWARLVDPRVSEYIGQVRLAPQQLIEQADKIKFTEIYVHANATEPSEMFKFDLPIVPAIAIPVQTKSEDTFEWPASHLLTFQRFLPDVTKILIIGWQAKEAHFLKLIRESRPRAPQLNHLMVVDANPDGASAILTRFIEETGLNPPPNSSVAARGFTNFVLNREGAALFCA